MLLTVRMWESIYRLVSICHWRVYVARGGCEIYGFVYMWCGSILNCMICNLGWFYTFQKKLDMFWQVNLFNIVSCFLYYVSH